MVYLGLPGFTYFLNGGSFHGKLLVITRWYAGSNPATLSGKSLTNAAAVSRCAGSRGTVWVSRSGKVSLKYVERKMGGTTPATNLKRQADFVSAFSLSFQPSNLCAMDQNWTVKKTSKTPTPLG